MITVTFRPSPLWDKKRTELLDSIVRGVLRKAFNQASVVTIGQPLKGKTSRLIIEASGTDKLKKLIRDRFNDLFNTTFMIKFTDSAPQPVENALEDAKKLIEERMKVLGIIPVSGPYLAEVYLVAPLKEYEYEVRHIVGALVTARQRYQDKAKVVTKDPAELVVIKNAAIYPGPTIVKVYLPGNEKMVAQFDEALSMLFQRLVPGATFQTDFTSLGAQDDRSVELGKVVGHYLTSDMLNPPLPFYNPEHPSDYKSPAPADNDYDPMREYEDMFHRP